MPRDGFTYLYAKAEVSHKSVTDEIGNIQVGEPAGFDDDLQLPVHLGRDVKVDGGVGPFFIAGGDYESVYVVKEDFPKFQVGILEGYTVVS